jgi:hypothetical protein
VKPVNDGTRSKEILDGRSKAAVRPTFACGHHPDGLIARKGSRRHCHRGGVP